MIGAQDTHEFDSGAYTGCVSSEMIKDLGAKYVIIGHSERRQLFGEDNELLSKKILSAHRHGLKVIFCIGELESEIKNRKSILRKQLKSLPKKLDHKKLIIAYEPVWAIGTGLTPTLLEIDSIHSSIRDILKFNQSFAKNVSILYGGSVNAENANDILSLENVDGALVGGASLKPKDFSKIIDYSS
jgi:triosephosphate isomerase